MHFLKYENKCLNCLRISKYTFFCKWSFRIMIFSSDNHYCNKGILWSFPKSNEHYFMNSNLIIPLGSHQMNSVILYKLLIELVPETTERRTFEYEDVLGLWYALKLTLDCPPWIVWRRKHFSTLTFSQEALINIISQAQTFSGQCRWSLLQHQQGYHHLGQGKRRGHAKSETGTGTRLEEQGPLWGVNQICSGRTDERFSITL